MKETLDSLHGMPAKADGADFARKTFLHVRLCCAAKDCAAGVLPPAPSSVLV